MRYCTGLAKIPGPFVASFTSLWKFYVVIKGEMPWVDTQLHEKYGDAVRIGPSHVSVASMEALNAVYVEKKGFSKVSNRRLNFKCCF